MCCTWTNANAFTVFDLSPSPPIKTFKAQSMWSTVNVTLIKRAVLHTLPRRIGKTLMQVSVVSVPRNSRL